MRKSILLFLIINLGTSSFYFASYPTSIDQLVKYSNHLNNFLSKKIKINEEHGIPFNSFLVGTNYLLLKSFEAAKETKVEMEHMKTNFNNTQKGKKILLPDTANSNLYSFKKITLYKIFTVICLGFILLIIQLSVKLEYRKKKAEILESKLENVNKDLTSFALDIVRKNEFTQEVGDKLKQIKKTTASGSRETLLQELIFKTHHHLKTNEDFEQFQKNIKKVNHAFFEKISTQFNNLTSNEIHLCGLIRLGLTIKDIASIKNISPKSVEMNRYRLRKKLVLKEGKDLHQFLLKI
jgi:hypothetical protein